MRKILFLRAEATKVPGDTPAPHFPSPPSPSRVAPRRLRIVLSVGLAGLLLVAGPGALEGLDRPGPGVFLPLGGDDQILLERVERAREVQNWNLVLEGLGRYAELALQPEVNTVIPSGGGSARGLRGVFARIAASLPPEERLRYKARLDPLLKTAWEESRDRASPGAHRLLRHRVLRDYPESDIYLAAFREEIDAAVQAGRWDDARRECEEMLALAETPGAEGGQRPTLEDQARARLLLISALAALGQNGTAMTHVAELRALRDSGKLAPSGKELSARMDALLEAAARIPETPAPRPQRELPGPLFQVSALEPSVIDGVSAPGGGGYRLGSRVWERRLPTSRLRAFLAERSRFASQGHLLLPYHAVAADGLIVALQADQVIAYDARRNREAWFRPLESPSDGDEEVRSPLLTRDACYYIDGQSLHAVRQEDGTPLWQRSFVYDRARKALRVVEGPPPWVPGDATPAPEPEESEESEAEPEEPRPPAAAGAKRKAAKPDPRPVYSIAPPAEIHGRVVLSLEVRVEREALFYLVSIEQSGEEAWKTFTGSSQGGDYLGLGGTTSIPLVREGRVHQLSNSGFVATVDAEDGAILWIAEYGRLGPRGKREASRTGNRWQPNPIVPVGSTLLLAPQDTANLLALDAATGEWVWRAPRERWSTLIGADARACFVAGREVSAVLHAGEGRGNVLWKSGPETPRGSLKLFGRPFLAPDAIIVPCRDSLVTLSPSDGSLLSRTFWDFSGGGGNLLLVDGLLAANTPEGILVYNHADAERARIESLSSNQPERMLERARFHLKNGEIEAGLAALEIWARSSPAAPAPNSPLDHLHLDVAELLQHLALTDPAGPRVRDLLGYRVDLERTPKRKVDAAIELAARLEKEGDLAGALGALHAALRHDNPATEYSPDGLLTVSSSAYIRDRILSIRKSTPGAVRAFPAVDGAARHALLEARSKGTPAAYLEIIHRFPYTPAIADAYLDLSEGFRDRLNLEQAILALEGYLHDYPDGEEAIRVKIIVANLLYQGGRAREAKERYLDLLERHGSSTVEGLPGMERSETVEQYVRPRLLDPGLRELPVEDAPALHLPIRMAWRSPADLHATHRTFLTAAGTPPHRLKGCFMTQAADVIECREIESGLPLWKVYLEMIPGFQFDESLFGFGFRYPSRTGKRTFWAQFVTVEDKPAGESAGDAPAQARPSTTVLVIHDDRNILGLDPIKGTVRWHVPMGAQKEAARVEGQPFRPQLKELLRGVGVTPWGIVASTSWNRLRRWNFHGEVVWDKELSYSPSTHPPLVFKDRIHVAAQASAAKPWVFHVHAAETGEEAEDVVGGEEVDSFAEALVRPPVAVEGGSAPGARWLLHFKHELLLIDLERGRIAWTFSAKRPRSLEEVAYFPESPAELVVFMNRANNWPAMLGVSLETGEEVWRYEKFPAARAMFHVIREHNRFYILHGQDQWSLRAIQVRSLADDTSPIVEALWPNEIPLGHAPPPSPGRLLAGGDSIFWVDPFNSISVYDKRRGVGRSTPAVEMSRFLVEKQNLAAAILRGKIILLTDGGDCAFESSSLSPMLGAAAPPGGDEDAGGDNQPGVAPGAEAAPDTKRDAVSVESLVDAW
ncbi:MAG TPA: PQQ-binding-like beta-propeller repeat protein, partial [Planctomycetota bacterium]|nr:PQQ-binding-like beta-propeller repeat protein [Planctomycetota bacterium]